MTMLLQRCALPVAHRSPVFGIGYLKHQRGQVAITMNSGILRMKLAVSPPSSGLKVAPVLGSQCIQACQLNVTHPNHSMRTFSVCYPFSKLLSRSMVTHPTHFQLCRFHTSPINNCDGADDNDSDQDLDSDPWYWYRFTAIVLFSIFTSVALAVHAKETSKELSQKLLGELNKPGADKLSIAVRILKCELFIGRGEEEASLRRVIDIVKGMELPDIIKTGNSLIDKRHCTEGILLYHILCVELTTRDLTSQEILVFLSGAIPEIARATKPRSFDRVNKYGLASMITILGNIHSLEHVDQDLKVATEAACLREIAYMKGELKKFESIRNLSYVRC